MNCLLIGHINKNLEDQIISIHKKCRCDISSVHSMDQAIDALNTKKPDLILVTGISKNVLPLIKNLRTATEATSVIVAIFEEDPPLGLDELLTLGIDDVILPPLNPYLLESRLQFAIKRAQQRLERNQIEAALRASEASVRAVVNTTVDGIITIDEHRNIQSFNRAAEQIFGYTAKEVIGKNVTILMPAPYREEHDGYVNSYHETDHKRIIGIGREVRGIRKNGETFPMELAVSEIKTDTHRAYTGIVRDITVRRELELELLQTSEEERRRIGQDIHDGLGQMLTGIGLIAQNLAKSLESKDKEEEANAVFELVDLIKNADQQARTIARTLIPVELENGGLKAASLRLGADIERLYGLKFTFEETGDIPEMPASVTTHFFRIIQEAMGNAARHSIAKHISLTIAGNINKIRARIKDNGIGIDFEHTNGRGMGLRIMQHRANVIGATLDIRKGSKNGTVVTCTLPLSAKP